MTPAGNSAGTRTGPVARSSVARVGVATRSPRCAATPCSTWRPARSIRPASRYSPCSGGLRLGDRRGGTGFYRRPPARFAPAPITAPNPWGRTPWGRNPGAEPSGGRTSGRRPARPFHPPHLDRRGVGLASAIVIAGTAPLWAARVFAEQRPLSVALLSVGLAGFCLHATLLGMLAGVGRWTEYGS